MNRLPRPATPERRAAATSDDFGGTAFPSRLLRLADRALAHTLAALQWLLLPLAALLFLQWPLREIVQRFSREANDLGQLLFALYVSAALTAATRARTHLETSVIASRYPQRTRDALAVAGWLLATIPWSLFVLVTQFDPAWQSLLEGEAFPDTFNPGYFIIKLAAWMMALLLLVQSLLELVRLSRRAGTG